MSDIDRIRQMVEEGRITAEEGEQLIAVLREVDAAGERLAAAGAAGTAGPGSGASGAEEELDEAAFDAAFNEAFEEEYLAEEPAPTGATGPEASQPRSEEAGPGVEPSTGTSESPASQPAAADSPAADSPASQPGASDSAAARPGATSQPEAMSQTGAASQPGGATRLGDASQTAGTSQAGDGYRPGAAARAGDATEPADAAPAADDTTAQEPIDVDRVAREAARFAEQTAREAGEAARAMAREVARQAREQAREAHHAAREAARAAAREAREAAREALRAARDNAREGAREALRAARDSAREAAREAAGVAHGGPAAPPLKESDRPGKDIAPAGTRWVTVEMLGGDLEVHAVPGLTKPTVEGGPGELRVDEVEDGYRVRFDPEGSGFLGGLISSLRSGEIVLQMPADHGLVVEATAGDVQVHGVKYLRGRMRAGDLDAFGLEGVDFSMTAGDLDATLDLRSGRHAITVGAGDVNVKIVEGSDVAVSGRVSIGDVSTTAEGLERRSSGLGGTVTGTIGTGAARLDLRVTTGDLEVGTARRR